MPAQRKSKVQHLEKCPAIPTANIRVEMRVMQLARNHNPASLSSCEEKNQTACLNAGPYICGEEAGHWTVLTRYRTLVTQQYQAIR